MQPVYQFGSISSGTMLPEDLIPAFASELRDQVRAAAPHPGAQNPDHLRLCDEADSITCYSCAEDQGILEDLFDALNEYAPDYGYFGSHPGDGADYGYWLDENFQERMREDGVLQVDDSADIPPEYEGAVLIVNDHGNATYAGARNGALHTIYWEVV